MGCGAYGSGSRVLGLSEGLEGGRKEGGGIPNKIVYKIWNP